jgi:hypothetical protein
MAKMREIKDARDTKVSEGETSPTPIETRQQQTEDRSSKEFTVRKLRLNESLIQFGSEIAKAGRLSDEKETAIVAGFEDLHVRSTSSQADAKAVYQNRNVFTARSIERELSACMREIERIIEELVHR